MSANAIKQIVHLGLGSFHRAHQAVYVQALLDGGVTDWQLLGGNIRDDLADTLAALVKQNGAYTLETVTPQGVRRYQRIAAISRVIPYQTGIAPLVQAAAKPEVKIISFTVTEAGYYLDSHDQLDLSFADLAADVKLVQSGAAGSTIYGALWAILRERMNASPSAGLTLMNCDNLRHNGSRFQSGLKQFIQLVGDKALGDWVAEHTRCPNAMVDRITPRPKPDVAARVKAATGNDDAAALMAEDFIQWVIEDHFAAERPPFERVGVEMVQDVAPYEEAKIRILNASHSCIAWAGTLAGYQYIHEGTQDTAIRQLAYDYVTNDVMPCLQGSPLDLAKYRDVVIDRFANPAIADTNQRVAMDGFSKIPGFIAPTIREALAAGRSIGSVAVLPALFLAFLQRWHLGQLHYTYQDQAMDQAAAHALCESPDRLKLFCADQNLWGDLAGNAALESAIGKAYAKLQQPTN